MGGNQSLSPEQQQQQAASDQQQLQYYQLMNRLGIQQLNASQPQVGIASSPFSSMGFSPALIDPWSYSGGGGYG